MAGLYTPFGGYYKARTLAVRVGTGRRMGHISPTAEMHDVLNLAYEPTLARCIKATAET